MGTQLPSPKMGHSPQFSAHLYCGQTAGWIKMPVGMEVGLSPGYFVLDGDPAHCPKRGGAHPIFGLRILWPNGCMDQGATWRGVRPRPRPTRYCVRCGPSYPQKKVHTHLHPIFGPCLLWPRSPIAATAELLLCAVRGLLKGPAFGTAPGPALALMRPWGRRLGRGRRGRHLRKGGTSTINKKLSPVFRSTGT